MTAREVRRLPAICFWRGERRHSGHLEARGRKWALVWHKHRGRFRRRRIPACDVAPPLFTP